MSDRSLVLDANILIRAAVGVKALYLIEANADQVRFFAPDVAFNDARAYLPELIRRRGLCVDSGLCAFEALRESITLLDEPFYEPLKSRALQRVGRRDPDDWPILACALTLECPIWTEDRDFFGTGVPVWTTDRVSMYLD